MSKMFKKRNLAKTLISLIVILFLVKAVGWSEVSNLFQRDFSLIVLLQFSAVAFTIVLFYACRWKLLVGERLTCRASLMSSLISLGGNMFLPARGGDILRIQYGRQIMGMPHATLISRLFVEKIVDLVTITIIGAVATMVLKEQNTTVGYPILVAIAIIVLALVFVSTILITFFNKALLSWLRPLFHLMKRLEFFDRHVVHLIQDASQSLAWRSIWLPLIVTFIMWLSAYALSYMLAAKFVGVTLPYTECLFVLFAGTLGLMLPAAPSGVGTFHASVVSAFAMLGRPVAEGLLVATATHLLFFMVFAFPAVLSCGSWRLGKTGHN